MRGVLTKEALLTTAIVAAFAVELFAVALRQPAARRVGALVVLAAGAAALAILIARACAVPSSVTLAMLAGWAMAYMVVARTTPVAIGRLMRQRAVAGRRSGPWPS